MPSQLNATPAPWKQEINRKIAAHKNRKGPVRVEPEMQPVQRSASSRAAEAMARVSARYAKAPSYNEILAGEARVAVRAAEEAARAAAKAHAAAQNVQAAAENILAGIEAASVAEPVRQAEAPAPVSAPEVPFFSPAFEAAFEEKERPRNYAVRWEEPLPDLRPQPEASGGNQSTAYEIVPEGWHESVHAAKELEHPDVEVVEAGYPIPGNLIEFPGELVATRRVRPRRMEGPLSNSAEPEAQLSIFEVDPSTVSTVAEEPATAAAAQTSIWQEQAWPSIELPAETEQEYEEALQRRRAEATSLDPAPASMRILAGVVNCGLVTGALLVAAAAAAWCGIAMPSLRTAEIGAGAGLLVVGMFYALLFCVLGDGTPGMYYAHLRLATFDGHRTSRQDRLVRLLGIVLSILPFGLGLAWMLFDEEHLCWHDRLSKTYLRRY
ncbi:MAG: RDD family protein [Terracidiphilus sp.]|nr:RDD family protein [Terracidiphilus sp.]